MSGGRAVDAVERSEVVAEGAEPPLSSEHGLALAADLEQAAGRGAGDRSGAALEAGATAGADVAAEADAWPANSAARAATGTDEAASARRELVFTDSPAPKRHGAARHSVDATWSYAVVIIIGSLRVQRTIRARYDVAVTHRARGLTISSGTPREPTTRTRGHAVRRCARFRSSGRSGRIQAGGDRRDAVADLDVPQALVHLRVMPCAQQGQVVQVGRAAVRPGVRMMGVADVARNRTARHQAPAVANDQRSPLRPGCVPSRPAQIEDGNVLGDEDAAQPPRAREQAQRAGVDGVAVRGVSETGWPIRSTGRVPKAPVEGGSFPGPE